MVKNIPHEFLNSYFSNLEKVLKSQGRVNVKHSFVEAGNVYINVYVKERDKHMAGNTNLNMVNSMVVEAINYTIDDNEPKVEIRKVEEVK